MPTAGMAVQCSIWESQLKGLVESPVKALNGNAIWGTPGTHRTSFITKVARGLTNFAQRGATKVSDGTGGTITEADLGYSSPPYATPFAEKSAAWIKYATQTDYATYRLQANTWYDGDGNLQYWGPPSLTYTGTATLDAHAFPVVSGYDYTTKWGAEPSPAGNVLTLASGSLTTAHWTRDQFLRIYDGGGSVIGTTHTYPETLVQTLSDAIDFSSAYTAAKAAMIAANPAWASAPKSFKYDEPGYPCNDGNVTVTDWDETSYSWAVVEGDQEPYGMTWNTITERWEAGFGPDTLFSGAQSGWMLRGDSLNAIHVALGQAKNTAGVPVGYFVARYRSYAGATTGKCTTGVTYTKSILELITVGTAAVDQVIAPPFPTTTPFPLTDLGNSVCASDLYFIVMGKSPEQWSTDTGLVFGTVTAVTA